MSNPKPKLSDTEALDQIARLMDQNEWDAEVVSLIAEAVRQTGRPVAYDDDAMDDDVDRDDDE